MHMNEMSRMINEQKDALPFCKNSLNATWKVFNYISKIIFVENAIIGNMESYVVLEQQSTHRPKQLINGLSSIIFRKISSN